METISLVVDVFWPHPMATEDGSVEHKCHLREVREFPSVFSMFSDNKKLKEHVSTFYKDPYTGESLVQKISCLYSHSLFPEKIIIILKSPLRVAPVDMIETVQESIKGSKKE